MKRLLIAFLGALSLFAQVGGPVRPHSLPDIVGTGATVQLSTYTVSAGWAATAAQWWQAVTPVGNAAVGRWGGPETAISTGSIIAAGGGQFIPPLGSSNYTPFSAVYFYIANGDKVTVTCGY